MTVQTQAWRWQAADKSLLLEPFATAELAPQQVLVRNTVAAVNPVDWKLIGWGPASWQQGQVPGVDGVGVIATVGSEVDAALIGKRVAYHSDLTGHGSFAGYTVIDSSRAMLIPDNVTDAQAASMPCPGLTAQQALGKLGNVDGKQILVCGGNSAVGLFAVQLLVKAGAIVWTTAAADSHPKLREMGAAHCFDYRDQSWPQQLVEQLPQGLDGAIDLVSSEHAASLYDLLGYGAHLVAVLGRVEPLGDAFAKCVSLHEVALGASYQYANALQIAELKQQGEQMLVDIGSGRLHHPELVIGEFAELPKLLQQAQSGVRKGKFLAVL
ncbi:alcohol dehydrogenase catalytic domain-containing protein [Ferrimonas senticii]|uniref:alcohol dehydrogenase catalytic domain-containing protein n=1 Tax=Ferrimonas senticii TaxID=394566 RepID=UPI00040FC678|nr:zinc-binding dehydrogenase [Ferrimonas senticii]